MSKVLSLARTGACAALLAAVLIQPGAAQMGSGMGGGMMGSGTDTPAMGSGSPDNADGSMQSGMGGVDSEMSGGIEGGLAGMGSGMGSGMGMVMGSGVGMGSGMGSGMGMSGPVIGQDGTAYVVRVGVGSNAGMMGGSSQAVKAELAALNPQNGSANWTLQIEGTMISEPVLKDGRIFLTTSEPNMGWNSGSGMNFNSNAAQRKPALVIVSAGATTASVLNSVSIDANMLSVPRIAPDGQTIYVVATDMPGMNANGNSWTTSGGGSYLYAFWPDGKPKFKVQLASYSGR